MRRVCVVFVAALAACAPADHVDGQSVALSKQIAFPTCTGGKLPAGLVATGWDHFFNNIIAAQAPLHSAQDVIALPGVASKLPGKFSYGKFSKDLEGEWIEVYMSNCAGGYKLLGTQKTDSDGRISLPLGAAKVLAGEYQLIFRVMGDGTLTSSMLRVYPKGTAFIVFDIDSTLTTSDTALWGQVIADLLEQDFPPEPRQGAQDLTHRRFDDQRYELLYLTSRPYLLTQLSRNWLEDFGFPTGTLHVVDEVGDSWPSDSKVGEYKRKYLTALKNAGYTVEYAYGNATTDIFAYEKAGIAKDRTYIVGDNGGESGTVDLGDDYWGHLSSISGELAVAQPFAR